MSNRLAEGQPLTYDYLAQIENELDTLRAEIRKLRGNVNALQDITVLYDNKASIGNAKKPNDILVIAGSDPIVFQGAPRTKIFQNVKFDSSFAELPLVVATVQDPGSQGRGGANVAFATVSLGKVSRTDFWFKVELVKSTGNIQNNDLRVNYIAIGKRQT